MNNKELENLATKYGYIEWENGTCEYFNANYISMGKMTDIKAIRVNKEQFEVKVLDDTGMVKIVPLY